MANATSTQLQELYVAYFGRAADPTGLDYWTEKGITTTKFAADMYAQAEFKDSYGSKSTEAQVDQIYQNLFDRAADVTGLLYWTKQIDLGVLKVAEIATHLIWAAQNNSGSEDDKNALTNRTNAAVAYTAEVKKTSAGVLAYSAKSTSPFEAGVNIAEAKSYMSGIDKDTAHTSAGVVSSVATIKTNGPAADYVAPVAAVVDTDKTLTVTSAIDTLTGGTANDTFNAVNTSTSTVLTNLDSLTGGDGTDTLSISDTAKGAYVLPTSLTLSGIETVKLSHLSDGTGDTITADFSNYADVDTVTIASAGSNITAATITTKANVQSLTIDGGNGADIDDVQHTESTTDASATVANTDVLSTVSLIGLNNQATALDTDSLTSITVKNVAGTVTNTDNYIATTDTRTLTVSHNGGTNGGVVDAGATTVNFDIDAAVTDAGTNTFTAAKTLNVDINAALTAGIVQTTAATDVNVTLDAAVTAMTLTTDAATTIDFSGTANATVTQNGASALVITNSGSGNLELATAIATGQRYVGGSGNDTITVTNGGTKANTTGAGNDTVTLTAVAGTGGSVDAGAGTADVVSMTAANAVTVTASTAFEADIANFERLTIGAIAASASTSTLALGNLDDINYVTSAGGASNGSAITTTISGFQSGGTLAQTALYSTNQAVTLTGSFTGATDTFNLKVDGGNGYANIGVLTLASVETINITTNDTTDSSAATTMFDLNLDADNTTTINISGDTGILFSNGSHAVVTTVDASGVTGTTTEGVVTFAAETSSNVTLTGGAGNDVLTVGAAIDTITGGAGADTLGGLGGVDTISGGAGADTITGGTGADSLTGGDGADIFVFSTAADSSTATYDSITDFTTSDFIRFVSGDDVAGTNTNAEIATLDVAIAALVFIPATPSAATNLI